MLYLWFFALLILLWHIFSRKPAGYPPGPAWWPVVGSMFELLRVHKESGYLFKACSALAKKYGPVVGLKVGCDRMVLLNDFESMKAMYANEDCDGRPKGPMYKDRTWGSIRGIITAEGAFWNEQRRFVMKHLREFGLGRKQMEKILEDEVVNLIKYVKLLYAKNNVRRKNRVETGKEHDEGDEKRVKNDVNSEGAIIEMHNIFNVSVFNSLWRMMANKRFSYDDEELTYHQKIQTQLMTETNMMGATFSHFPILRTIAPEWSGYKFYVDMQRQVEEFLQNELDNHKKTLSREAPRDLMDAYLLALESSDVSDNFSDLQLLAICMDLFAAGSESTSKTLGFAFMNMLRYKEVQRKAHAEIDRVVGRDRLPTLEDRSGMPYANAIVFEAVRMFMGRNLNIPHNTMKDTYILNYRIPKNTMIFVNYNAILMDDKIFENPEEFRPERFLDENSNIVVPDEYFPFSLGKRRCMGEILAKSNLFLMITTLLQSFEFSLPPGENFPTPECVEGITAGPPPYRALVTLRN